MPVRPKPTRQSNPRPINKQDSSAKFPNRLTYPNGTYASTGSIGGTGSFGANLPVKIFNNSTTPTNARFSMQPIPRYNLPNTTPIPNVRSPYTPLVAQGSFVSSNGQVNLQGATTGGRGAVPTTQDRINATLQNQFAIPQPSIKPQGVFTGDPQNNPNDAAWVNYWNYQAANPGPKAPPVVMTRDQIWNVKAQQRKRKNQEREEDDNNRQADERRQKKPEPTYQPFFTKTVGFRTGTG